VRARFEPPAVLTHLHRVELVTAWELKVFRKEIPVELVEQALGHLDEDIAAGIWEPPAYDLADVFAQAESLGRRHVSSLGARSLDILHVAAARLLAKTEFVTADARQADLAKAVGMRVILLGSPAAKRPPPSSGSPTRRRRA